MTELWPFFETKSSSEIPTNGSTEYRSRVEIWRLTLHVQRVRVVTIVDADTLWQILPSAFIS